MLRACTVSFRDSGVHRGEVTVSHEFTILKSAGRQTLCDTVSVAVPTSAIPQQASSASQTTGHRAEVTGCDLDGSLHRLARLPIRDLEVERKSALTSLLYRRFVAVGSRDLTCLLRCRSFLGDWHPQSTSVPSSFRFDQEKLLLGAGGLQRQGDFSRQSR